MIDLIGDVAVEITIGALRFAKGPMQVKPETTGLPFIARDVCRLLLSHLPTSGFGGRSPIGQPGLLGRETGLVPPRV